MEAVCGENVPKRGRCDTSKEKGMGDDLRRDVIFVKKRHSREVVCVVFYCALLGCKV